MRRYAAEFMGTFILVALGPGAVMVSASKHAFGVPGVALAFGLAVTIVVAATGHIGGAHINPAVTLGLWSVRRFPGRDVPAYVVAQCLGAVAASALLVWIVGPVGNFGATVPTISTTRAFVVEGGYTAILGFTVMGVSNGRMAQNMAPFAVGATIFLGALVTGPLTGGSFNPARSLGPAIVGNIWTAHWLYWIGPILGAAVGMRAYAIIDPAGAALTATENDRTARSYESPTAEGL
jgi:aquaporin NIP